MVPVVLLIDTSVPTLPCILDTGVLLRVTVEQPHIIVTIYKAGMYWQYDLKI